MKIITSRTKVLAERPNSILIRQPCGCEYWYHDRRKLCPHIVKQIALKVSRGDFQRDVAKLLGIGQATVSEAINGKRRYVA